MFDLSPGLVAKGDQLAEQARTDAAYLLAAYIAFCRGVDENAPLAADEAQDIFVKIFAQFDPGRALSATAWLCDLVVKMVHEKHGSWESIDQAIEEGKLFLNEGGDETLRILQQMEGGAGGVQ